MRRRAPSSRPTFRASMSRRPRYRPTVARLTMRMPGALNSAAAISSLRPSAMSFTTESAPRLLSGNTASVSSLGAVHGARPAARAEVGDVADDA